MRHALIATLSRAIATYYYSPSRIAGFWVVMG